MALGELVAGIRLKMVHRTTITSKQVHIYMKMKTILQFILKQNKIIVHRCMII